jgi:hypothetical protein
MSDTPAQLNRAIELHDSYLGRINSLGNSVELYFEPAYIHQSSGRPGFEPGTGWNQNAVFKLQDASTEGEPFDLPADIYEGKLEIDGNEVRDLLPVPSDYSGRIVLTLSERTTGRTMLFWCSRLTVSVLGEAKYVEEIE